MKAMETLEPALEKDIDLAVFSTSELLAETVRKLSLAESLPDVTAIVRTVARKLTGADGATFVLKDHGYCYYVDEDAITPLWKGNRFPMETCISGWVMNNKEPVIIHDIYSDERIPSEVYRPTFVKSMAMVPIRKDSPIGAIGNYWAEYKQPGNRELALLQALADITSVSLENIEVNRKLKEKLNERNLMLNQLKTQNAQLEEFTQIISHNMRAPLVNLMLLNEMISESDTTEEKEMLFGKQKTVLECLHETFEELVKATQVKMDFSVTKEYVNLTETLYKTLTLLQIEIMDRGAVITSSFSEVNLVFYSKVYLESILFNLVCNALKYSKPGHQPEVNIHTFRENGWNYLEVKDNGLGIDLDKHGKNIFRMRKTFHNHPDAKGFGLYITRNQIEAMGGEISVKSKPGEGTSFIIKLTKV